MAQYENLKNAIRQVIKRNGNEEITGNLLQQVLIAMVNALGTGYQFVGVAAPDADPGTTDNRLCYLAAIPGTYTHFGGIVIEPGETAFLTYGTSWNKITIADSPVIWVDVWDLSHYASLATKIAVFKVLRDAIIQHVNKTVVCIDGENLFYPTFLHCPEDTQDYVSLVLLGNDGIVYSFAMEAVFDEELEITGVNVWYHKDIRFADDATVKSEIQRAKDAEYQIQFNVEMLNEELQRVSQRELDTDADFEQRITDIEGIIPAQATAENQLADKQFVNSSIATNTANFIGTFNSLEELEQYPTAELTNNDYAFVIGSDSEGNRVFSRYKWNGEEWLFEYELNNSSFTAQQWETINSGLTSDDVTSIRAALTLIGNVIPDDASATNPLVSRKYVEDRHIILPLLTLDATQEQLALVYNSIMNAPTGSAFFISLPENRGIMPLATAKFATSVFAQYADGRYSHELKITLADGVYEFEKTDKTFATSTDLNNKQDKLSFKQLENIEAVPNKAEQSEVGDLSELQTTDKSSIVNAINEVAQGRGGSEDWEFIRTESFADYGGGAHRIGLAKVAEYKAVRWSIQKDSADSSLNGWIRPVVGYIDVYLARQVVLGWTAVYTAGLQMVKYVGEICYDGFMSFKFGKYDKISGQGTQTAANTEYNEIFIPTDEEKGYIEHPDAEYVIPLIAGSYNGTETIYIYGKRR